MDVAPWCYKGGWIGIGYIRVVRGIEHLTVLVNFKYKRVFTWDVNKISYDRTKLQKLKEFLWVGVKLCVLSKLARGVKSFVWKCFLLSKLSFNCGKCCGTKWCLYCVSILHGNNPLWFHYCVLFLASQMGREFNQWAVLFDTRPANI